MPDIQTASAAIPLPSAELNLGGTSTSEKQFLTASAQNGVAAGQPLTCFVPGVNVMKNRPVVIRVGGRVTAVGACTFKLYQGSSSTIASNNNIATTGSLSPSAGAGACNWGIEITGCMDSTSNTINGLLKGWVGGATAVAQAILTATAAFTIANASSTLGLTVTGTFATGSASNVAFVDWFEVLPM